MSFTLALDATPAGLSANLISQVYGQYIQNLDISQADKVRPPPVRPPRLQRCLVTTYKNGVADWLFICLRAAQPEHSFG